MTCSRLVSACTPACARVRVCVGTRNMHAHAHARTHAYAQTLCSATLSSHLGSISASPTACPLCGCGRAGTRKDRLSVLRGGHFEYRHVHTRAMGMPSATPRWTEHDLSCALHKEHPAAQLSRPIQIWPYGYGLCNYGLLSHGPYRHGLYS